ncbi:MAG TPA: hypothetical protein PLR02_12540 [Rhodocyclaceae bacterium]|jgi:hypothetical protein|nr:hypothetical protein [Rhodocyclaceae bacterium]
MASHKHKTAQGAGSAGGAVETGAGTNTTTTEAVGPAPGAMASGAATEPPGVAEAAREDLARQAEAVTAPGGSVEEVLGQVIHGMLDEAVLPVTHLRVRATREGFRRCGRAWSVAEQRVSADEFSEDEILRMLTDPDLVVVPECGPLAEIE